MLHIELRISDRDIEALLVLRLGVVSVKLLEHLLSLLGALSSNLVSSYQVKP
jgi:hypothetical protein